MGLAKRAMEEYDELVWDETAVTFTCPVCNKLSDGAAEIPKIYRGDLFDYDHPISITCIWCDAEFEATIQSENLENKISLDEYPNVAVEFEPIYFEEINGWEDWEDDYYFQNPENPIENFRDAHADLLLLCQTLGTPDDLDAINRMIFAQSFAIYEAYLCDAYLNLVFQTEENQVQFIKQHTDMKKMSISVEELLSNKELTANDLLKKKITQLIKKTLFHNLDRVVALFGFYDIEIFTSVNDRSDLFEAVEKRHHCVHRNGKDLDGNLLKGFDRDFCQRILAAILASAECITASANKRH